MNGKIQPVLKVSTWCAIDKQDDLAEKSWMKLARNMALKEKKC